MSNIIVNTATLHYDDDRIVSDTVELPYDINYLTMSKTIKNPSYRYITVGQNITFSITVTNQSQEDLVNIFFDDDFDSSVWKYVDGTLSIDGVSRTPMSILPLTYNFDVLSAGTTSIIEFDLHLLESYDGDDGMLLNTASIEHNGNIYQAQAGIIFAKLLQIEKITTHTGIVKPNDIVRFELHITNPNKDRSISDVLVMDPYDINQWEYIDNTLEINGVPTIPQKSQPLETILYNINSEETVVVSFDLRALNFI